MLNFFERCDFLSKQEYLRINGKKRYQNIIGGLMSLFIVVFSVVMIVYFIVEILNNKDPKVYESKKINKAGNNFTLEKKAIEFFVSLEFSNSTYYLDETVYKVFAILSEMRFIQINGTVKQDFTEKKIKMIRCSDIYSAEEINNFNVNFPQKLFYCFPSGTAYFGGLWGSTQFSSLKIYITKCTNKTLEINDSPCKQIEYINSIIDYGIISLMVSDYLIDHKNHTYPLTKYIHNVFDRLSAKNAINYFLTYSNLIYSSDTGWIFNNFDYNEYPVIGEFKTSYNFGEENIISLIQIECSYFQISYIRSFIKLQELLTNIGGFVKSLILLGNLLIYLYSYSFSTIDNVFLNHINTLASEKVNLIKLDHNIILSNSLNKNSDKKNINLKNYNDFDRKNNNHEYIQKENIVPTTFKACKNNQLEKAKSEYVHNYHLNLYNDTSKVNLNMNNKIENINISRNIDLSQNQPTIYRKILEFENSKLHKNIKNNISN